MIKSLTSYYYYSTIEESVLQVDDMSMRVGVLKRGTATRGEVEVPTGVLQATDVSLAELPRAGRESGVCDRVRGGHRVIMSIHVGGWVESCSVL